MVISNVIGCLAYYGKHPNLKKFISIVPKDSINLRAIE